MTIITNCTNCGKKIAAKLEQEHTITTESHFAHTAIIECSECGAGIDVYLTLLPKEKA